jgi:hypothetical protein
LSAHRSFRYKYSIRDADDAGVVKLVNTRDLKSLGFGLAGSSPAARTNSFGLAG